MSYHFINEAKWIEDIKKGCKAAFRYAFDYFYVSLCNYLSNLIHNPDLAEDIVQEVFITLWNKRKTIIITTSLKKYLYKSCYNRYIDIYRKNQRTYKKLEELRYVKLMELQEEDLTLKQEKLERLQEVIENLPPKCKQVFLLSKYEGLKYLEIAQKLDISVKTVENQIGKAYNKLREEFAVSESHK